MEHLTIALYTFPPIQYLYIRRHSIGAAEPHIFRQNLLNGGNYQMKIITTPDPAAFERYAEECLSGHEGVVVCINNAPCVWTGQLATLDVPACKHHGLYVGTGQYLGGSIVNMPGDLSVCITTWGSSEVAPQIVDKAVEWLSGLGINLTRDENDVLAAGKKVISWARATTVKGWCQSVIHFSIGKMDLELVKEICTKPMEKIPGALSEYGITAKDCEKIVMEALAKENGNVDE